MLSLILVLICLYSLNAIIFFLMIMSIGMFIKTLKLDNIYNKDIFKNKFKFSCILSLLFIISITR